MSKTKKVKKTTKPKDVYARPWPLSARVAKVADAYKVQLTVLSQPRLPILELGLGSWDMLVKQVAQQMSQVSADDKLIIVRLR